MMRPVIPFLALLLLPANAVVADARESHKLVRVEQGLLSGVTTTQRGTKNAEPLGRRDSL